jgi:hypothetical protein
LGLFLLKLQDLLQHVFSISPVHRNSSPEGQIGEKLSYDDLLEDAEPVPDKHQQTFLCRIRLPFIWFSIYVSLNPGSFNDLFSQAWPNLLAPPDRQFSLGWSAFEVCCARLQVLRVNLLLSYLKYKAASLAQIFVGLGSREDKEISITLQQLRNEDAVNRFPRTFSADNRKSQTQIFPKNSKTALSHGTNVML